jgi:hypothetical protein
MARAVLFNKFLVRVSMKMRIILKPPEIVVITEIIERVETTEEIKEEIMTSMREEEEEGIRGRSLMILETLVPRIIEEEKVKKIKKVGEVLITIRSP